MNCYGDFFFADTVSHLDFASVSSVAIVFRKKKWDYFAIKERYECIAMIQSINDDEGKNANSNTESSKHGENGFKNWFLKHRCLFQNMANFKIGNHIQIWILLLLYTVCRC